MIHKYLPFIVCFPLCSIGQGVWTQKANFGGVARYEAAGFSIGTKGYIGTGAAHWFGPFYNDFWEWDQNTNAWTQKANFSGVARGGSEGFSIGNKGYIGFGSTNFSSICPCYNDVWEYDPISNTWTQKPNSSVSARGFAFSFVIGLKAYIGTGYDGSAKNDLWEWDPANNTWTQKANFSGNARLLASAFAIGTNGYVGTGWSISSHYNDFWSWDQTSNSWSQKANFPGPARAEGTAFTIGTKGYMGTGTPAVGSGPSRDDFWEYNATANSWTQLANFAGGLRECAVGFSIGCLGYMGTGWVSDVPSTVKQDFWEFTPPSGGNITVSASSMTACPGQQITLSAQGGNSYSWNTGATSSIIVVTPTASSTYTVNGLTGCGQATSTISITMTPVYLDPPGWNGVLCQGDTIQLAINGASYYSWAPVTGLSNSSIANPFLYPTTTTTYTVTASNTAGCSTVALVTVNVQPPPLVPIISQSGDTLISSPALSYQWVYNSTLLPGVITQTIAPSQSGSYQVIISDANGCTATSATYSFTSTTGISESDETNLFQLTPNPNQGEFTLDFRTGLPSRAILTVTDLLGHVVYTARIPAMTRKMPMNLRQMGAGLYSIQVKGDQFNSTRKVVIH